MKSKIKGELTRLKNVIESDRLSVAENFDELITSDLYAVLSDYFDLRTPPVLTVSREAGGYLIRIESLALRIKTFGVVPKNQQ